VIGGKKRSTRRLNFSQFRYHGLRRKYLQTYLDEFVFRFNRRRTPHAAFRSLFAIALNAKPATYNMLVRPDPCA
jgi:hypothetical protein